jgi:hypothetical protein
MYLMASTGGRMSRLQCHRHPRASSKYSFRFRNKSNRTCRKRKVTVQDLTVLGDVDFLPRLVDSASADSNKNLIIY